MINLVFVLTAVIALFAASGSTPWQLFQSLCPFVSAQSPQCLSGTIQPQIPQQQIPQQQIPQQQIPQQQIPQQQIPQAAAQADFAG
jgi:hypothetical protein